VCTCVCERGRREAVGVVFFIYFYSVLSSLFVLVWFFIVACLFVL